jgi:crotonobetainyl-CoA:carnitine CoA-transferase CaiB-like acyl-CoA transferase
MYGAMQGVRVLEVSRWWLSPAAGAILADWGADVIKVEDQQSGDPMRANQRGDYVVNGRKANFMFEQANRGKRSIGLDLSRDEGREIFYELVRGSDVFCCSLLPEVRRRLRVDVDDIRRANPNIIYVRGSGYGPKGPDAGNAAFDFTASWSRGGLAYVHRRSLDDPPIVQRAAYADTIGSLALACGISAALFRRAVSGEPAVIDVSLLGVTAWLLSVDVIGAKVLGKPWVDMGDIALPNNPLHCMYQTKDGEWVAISMPQADRYWPNAMRVIGRPDLIDDPRFCSAELRARNAECTALIREAFASATVAEWRERLKELDGPWSIVQGPGDLHQDEQVLANGYIQKLDHPDGSDLALVAAPVQFDEESSWPNRRAPEHAEQTDEILMELLEYDIEKILNLKIDGIVT